MSQEIIHVCFCDPVPDSVPSLPWYNVSMFGHKQRKIIRCQYHIFKGLEDIEEKESKGQMKGWNVL